MNYEATQHVIFISYIFTFSELKYLSDFIF
jgi:hypothetical protein